MTQGGWEKVYKQIKGKKPGKEAKFLKHNKPKDRDTGRDQYECKRCKRVGAHIHKYDLQLCRQCFREIATDIGFKKYS